MSRSNQREYNRKYYVAREIARGRSPSEIRTMTELTKNRGGVMYLMETENGFVKVGYTTNLWQRYLATRNSPETKWPQGKRERIWIIGTIQAEIEQEAAAHVRFNQYRIGRSEWYPKESPICSWFTDHNSFVPYIGEHLDIQPPTDEEEETLS